FFRKRFTSEFLYQTALRVGQLVDRFHHVHRDTDRAGLIGNGTGDGLTHPPGGVSRELKSTALVEFFHRSEEANVSFLDQVKEGQPSADVLLGNCSLQSMVRFRYFLVGARISFADGLRKL